MFTGNAQCFITDSCLCRSSTPSIDPSLPVGHNDLPSEVADLNCLLLEEKVNSLAHRTLFPTL